MAALNCCSASGSRPWARSSRPIWVYSTACWVGGRAARRRARIWSSWKGGLAVAGFGVGAAETRGGLKAVGFGDGGAAGRDEGAELSGFGIRGMEFEGLVDVASGSGEVAAVVLEDGEVVVVVGVVGVCGGGAAEEGDGVLMLAVEGDALVVEDFGERQARGDEGEGLLGVGVFGGVEAGEAEVEVGFEGSAVGERHFG